MPSDGIGAYWRLFVPKFVTVLREGYGLGDLRADLMAGLTVAVVALPLSMALAIASGTTPDKGLVTAIVAGFLISFLGGSRHQIGGPTGAFVVVVFGVIAEHGYDGLVLATLMAGLMVIAGGLLKLGTYIKYIPQPVVTGFTAGIAVIIFTSQVGDFLGMALDNPPADFLGRWQAYAGALGRIDPATVAVAAGSLAAIVALRRFRPRWPAFLIAIVAFGVLVGLGGLPVETVGSRFGEIPSMLPTPAWPEVTVARVVELLPSAATIAFLAAIESLLSAMVADTMAGRRHRSNCEMVAQGVANCASALFGGLPATGAIARTATSIRSGARSPIAGMIHAAVLLVIMVAFGGLAVFIPMGTLAAVLMIVAWNMSEFERFRALLSGPVGDRVVLVITFLLTVLVDLTVAIEVGVVLAAVLFMHRMAEVVSIGRHAPLIEEDVDDFTQTPDRRRVRRRDLPPGVEAVVFRGPLFFGVSRRMGDALDRTGSWPRVLIVGLDDVPFVDATGLNALTEFLRRAQRHGARILLVGANREVRLALTKADVHAQRGTLRYLPTMEQAVEVANGDML